MKTTLIVKPRLKKRLFRTSIIVYDLMKVDSWEAPRYRHELDMQMELRTKETKLDTFRSLEEAEIFKNILESNK